MFRVAICLIWLLAAASVHAYNNSLIPSLTESNLSYFLSHPCDASGLRLHATDSAGNEMHVPSVMEIAGQAYKYVAVYHTPQVVGNGAVAFNINLAGSNDLLNWTFLRKLVGNATMPKIAKVSNGEWIVLTYEHWMNQEANGAILGPCQIGFKLFYNANDLLSGAIRSSWIQPQFTSALNGTPSIYTLSLAQDATGYYFVNGQFGFHYNNGGSDQNAVTSVQYLFDPLGRAVSYPSQASAYNTLLTNAGAAGHIGQRDTIVTTNARYNIQEVNLSSTNTWNQWRLFLCKFNDGYAYPTGNETLSAAFSPVTPGGSTSIGNPSVSVLNRPDGSGSVLFVSYFVFGEGAAPGEAGSLIYYFNIGPFVDWQLQHFGSPNSPIAAATADPDKDGLANLVEYAIGSDPNLSSPNPIQSDFETIAGKTYLRLSMARDPAVTNIAIDGLSTGTLADPNAWSSATTVIESNTASLFRVRDSLPVESNPQRFLRLRLVQE